MDEEDEDDDVLSSETAVDPSRFCICGCNSLSATSDRPGRHTHARANATNQPDFRDPGFVDGNQPLGVGVHPTAGARALRCELRGDGAAQAAALPAEKCPAVEPERY